MDIQLDAPQLSRPLALRTGTFTLAKQKVTLLIPLSTQNITLNQVTYTPSPNSVGTQTIKWEEGTYFQAMQGQIRLEKGTIYFHMVQYPVINNQVENRMVE